MGLLASKEPGVLLAGKFDRNSKTLKAELAAMVKKLEELMAARKLSGFLTATKRVGDVLHIKILAAGPEPLPVARPARARPAGGGGWSPQARAAREVAAQVQAELRKK